jgi:hypothetical protein
MRKRGEAVDRHDQSGAGRDHELAAVGLHLVQADEADRDDEAERAEDANRREVPARVLDALHRDRVGEPDSREVGEAEHQHHPEDAPERRHPSDHEQQRGGDDVKERHHPLGRKEPVGDQADEEGRYERGE